MSTIDVNEFAVWAARDYVKLPPIIPGWRVLEVGPGDHPFERADVYVDSDVSKLKPLREAGKSIIRANIQDGLPILPDGAFDFCFIAHVLEHVVEIQEAVDTLNRIAKRGCAVMPSFAKDSLFHFEEAEHFWHVLPNPTHGEPPIFVEQSRGFIQRLRDPMCQKAASFLYRTGTQHDCTAERHLRTWYQEHEPMLDIVAHWDEERPLKVIAIR